MIQDVNSIAVLIRCIQDYYDGKPIEAICEKLKVSQEAFNGHIRELGEVANELLDLRDENTKLKTMYINLSLVNQGLRDSLDALAAEDSSILELISAHRREKKK